MKIKLIYVLIGSIIIFNAGLTATSVNTINIKSEYEIIFINGPPQAPCNVDHTIVKPNAISMDTQVIIQNVPSSTWTYGCSPTAAGMLFGYYDRSGFPNMYTGPCNNGICPLVNLGQGSKDQESTGYPVNGSCYIIATEQGLDGINTSAHADDYYVSIGSSGDPFTGSEHEWDLCVADYVGSSQWKWDFDENGVIDRNQDGGTTYVCRTDGLKLYDYKPGINKRGPSTAFCHGLRLFAQSRGYQVITNYNQFTDNYHASGFTFQDYKREIDVGRPVILHLSGHSILGIGYDDSTEPQTIFVHDTWDNNIHKMAWGGRYANSAFRAVSVIQLNGGTKYPIVNITYPPDESHITGIVQINGTAYDSDGSVTEVQIKINDNNWETIEGTEEWSYIWDAVQGSNIIKFQAFDDDEAVSPEASVNIIVNNNLPNNPTSKYNSLLSQLYITGTDIDNDKVRYGVSWSNDQTVDQWTKLVESGTEQSIDCRDRKGPIGVIVEDEYGGQSEWISTNIKLNHDSVEIIPTIFQYIFDLLNIIFNVTPFSI